MKKPLSYIIPFYLTAALVLGALVILPAIFGGWWMLLYAVTMPIAWEYLKILKQSK